MSLIFLSHSGTDDVECDEVRLWLRERGHESIFLDHHGQDGIAGGEAWEERLYTELRRCRALIALLSPEWLESPWCIAEANQAQAHRKSIIPLRIADIAPETWARCAPPAIQRTQGIDWHAHDAKARLAEALLHAGLDPRRPTKWSGDRDPYPGLATFERLDAPVYFGRDQEIADLLSILDSCRATRRPRLIVVEGDSGTGKSSLVRAGILPALERDLGRWLVVPPMRPLATPFAQLVEAFTVADEREILPPPQTSAAGPTGRLAWTRWIVEAANRLRATRGQNGATVVITIDQIEEALSGLGKHADDFLLTVRDALATTDFRLLVLATLRSDFGGTFQRHPAVREGTFAYDAPGRFMFAGSRTTPTVDGEYVYTVGPVGDLYAISTKTRKAAWRKNIWKEFGGGQLPQWAIVQNPLTYGDLLIVAPQTSEAGVVAYDKVTGDLKWKSAPLSGIPGYVTPSVFKVGTEDQLVMVTGAVGRGRNARDGSVNGLDPRSGRVLWTYTDWQCIIPVPQAVDAGQGRVLITGGYGAGSVMLKVDKKSDGSYGVAELFRNLDFGAHTQPPVLHAGHFYAHYTTNERADGLVAMGMDGQVKWKTGQQPAFTRGGVILADGLMLMTDGNTKLYLVEPSSSGFNPLASAVILAPGDNWAPLALSQGKLLVRGQKELKVLQVVQ